MVQSFNMQMTAIMATDHLYYVRKKHVLNLNTFTCKLIHLDCLWLDYCLGGIRAYTTTDFA